MIVDAEAMANIANRLFAVHISRELGANGAQLLRELIQVVRDTHKAVATERLVHGLAVLRTTKPTASLASSPAATFTTAMELTAWYRTESGPLSVYFSPDGRIYAWTENIDFSTLDGEYIVYKYLGHQKEILLTPSGNHEVPTVANFPSYFAIPYFLDLRESLVKYGSISVRSAQCDTFVLSWREQKRLVLVNRPEATMRRSLQRYLRASLRDHEMISVLPEQNVNETRPVDLKISWSGSNRVALIEIKWLGLSVGRNPGKSTLFDERRAREGAQQLADYLDEYHKNEPDSEARGYLVVFDCQRKGVVLASTSVTIEDGMYFANKEISYQQNILSRSDFEAPVRLFCEPICG